MKTKENLLKAFAGECQARARYEMAAKVAGESGLAILQDMLHFTANQEKEHAIIFYNFLKETFHEENITMTGNYPIDLETNLSGLLKAAKENENDEATKIYKEFSEDAKNEGYSEIAATFMMISDIEAYHSQRFDYYFQLLTSNTLHHENSPTRWMCLNCGFIYEGNQALEVCPVCKHDVGYALRLKETQFNV